MVRAIVLYEEEPDPTRYEQHAELCRKVPGGTFQARTRLRRSDGSGLPLLRRWEWPDKDAFKSAARSEEFMATGKDAMDMGGSSP